MERSHIDPSLLYLEVPLYLNDLQLPKYQEIVVDEGEANVRIEGCNFDDYGGGENVSLPIAGVKRTIYWKTRGNVLEIFENSLQINLTQNHVQIHFLNSKVLPAVKIYHINKQVIILCATLHAAHRIILNTAHLKQYQSVLSGLSRSLFSEPKNNFYFTQIEQITCFSSSLSKRRQSISAIFAFGVNTGNVIVLKMPTRGQAILSRLNRASTISRIWSGLNPWSGSHEGDIPCDIKSFGTADPKVIAICRDNKMKIWSVQSNDCLNQLSLLEYIDEDVQTTLGKCHQIRTASFDENDYHLITVYLTFDEVSLFVSFEYNQENNSFIHLSTIKCEVEASQLTNHLVDYEILLSCHLWALWQDAHEELILSVCDINQKVWQDVALAPSPPQEVVVPSNLSIPEAYLNCLFTSGNFSSVAIGKALSMHQRNVFSTRSLSWRTLRESVIKVIQGEIENQLPDDGSASLADTLEAQLSTWMSFYQTCLQYQKFVSKPMGITQPDNDGFVVVKKEYISHLVPVSSLEAMCRGASPSLCNTALLDDPDVDELGKLLSSLSLLSNILGQDYIDTLLFALAHQENPMELVQNELDNIKEFLNERLDRTELQQSLFEIADLNLAVNMLLTCLDPGSFDGDLISSSTRLLTGDCGIEILCGVVRRYISDRLQLSLLLLIITILFDELQNTAPPRVSIYVQAYSAIKWAVTARVEHAPQSSLESTLQSLSVHEVNHYVPSTLIEYYLRCEGGCQLQQLLDLDGSLNHEIMPRAAAALVHLLWPLGPMMSFPEFLFSKAQFSRLQHYLEQELRPWCDFCPSYSLYLLGLCQLHTGQYNKAVETFLQGAGKLTSEEVHLRRLLAVGDDDELDRVEGAFYTKVLQTFEEIDLAEQVILIASRAIEKISPDDPGLPTLCSSVFRQSLSLRRHDDAYRAIVWNPDPEHRKDCLRAMVVALCERREYKTLIEYPYDDLHDELVLILEHRARCSDLSTATHQYYDLLFAFHVYRDNYRRAASVMYEQAWRVGMEQKSSAAVRKRRNCLVAALSCLMLVDPENHWIVHPKSAQEARADGDGGKSPKRTYEGEEVTPSQEERKIVVCELEDLQKEILLVEARIKVAEEAKNDSAMEATVTPHETVAMLNHAGLYEEAFKISSKFNISPVSTFQSITTRCVQCSYVTDDPQVTSWIAKHDHTAHVDGRSSAADVAWRLLKNFLDKHGSSPGCYRAVLITLLGYSCKLPAWFLNKYKQLNAPELLRLLICYDYLEDATMISMEYIDGVLGVCPEHFNIKSTLSSIGGPVWLPYSELELLLHVLREECSQTKYLEMNSALTEKLDYYFIEAEKVAVAKCMS